MLPEEKESYISQMEKPLPKNIKVAFSTKSPVGGRVDAEAVKAVEKTAQYLDKLGFDVEEKEPPVNGKKVANSYFMICI